jgi:hypothetical protein
MLALGCFYFWQELLEKVEIYYSFISIETLVKIFLMESGRNGGFRHETPKVIARFFSPMVETPLNIKIAVYFKRIQIDVFSAENVSLYAVIRHIFQR